MDRYTLLVSIANAATLLTGGAIAVLAHRAFRRTESAALRAVAVGFGFVVLGSIGGGVIHLVGGNVRLAVTIQSTFVAGGFAILLYSLYAETSTTTTKTVLRSD